jgi:putative two-component system response regulator
MASQRAVQTLPDESHRLVDTELREPDYDEPTLPSSILDLPSAWRQRYTDLQTVSRGHHEVLLRFAAAVALREGDTAAHLARIGRLSEMLALAHTPDANFARLVRLASPLHDIGKVGLPDEIISRQGVLTTEEWTVIRRHPQLGAQILSEVEVPSLRLAAEIALAHHEKFDGSGYPQGLSGAAIPLAGRIVALIDFFDALTTDRPYRKALADAQVLDMIVAESGRHFDPELTRAFLGVKEALIAERERINAEQMPLDELVRQ